MPRSSSLPTDWAATNHAQTRVTPAHFSGGYEANDEIDVPLLLFELKGAPPCKLASSIRAALICRWPHLHPEYAGPLQRFGDSARGRRWKCRENKSQKSLRSYQCTAVIRGSCPSRPGKIGS